MTIKTPTITAILLITACGGSGTKGDDTGGSGSAVGPGACHIETAADGTAVCYTFSGGAWSDTTAEEYCGTRENPGATVEWLADENCPSDYDGACAVDTLSFPGLDFTFEMYFYGMTADAGENACDLVGGEWSE